MRDAITIRPIELFDTDNIVKWRNAPSVKKYLYSQDELTAEQHRNYFHTYITTGKVKQFIISENHDGECHDIGTSFIKNIDTHSNKAEFGIFIGEENVRGKGYGTIATKLTVDYAFDVLKLNRLYLTVFSDNVAAIKAYKNCGFTIEGNLKQDFLRYDGYADVSIMAIVNDSRRKVRE